MIIEVSIGGAMFLVAFFFMGICEIAYLVNRNDPDEEDVWHELVFGYIIGAIFIFLGLNFEYGLVVIKPI